MNVVSEVKRKAIKIRFSKDFEALLLAQDTEHLSLTHDLEYAVQIGLEHLQSIESIDDIDDVDRLRRYINSANSFFRMSNGHFSYWIISISEDILDEIELIRLTHGDDLVRLGLPESEMMSRLVVMAAVVGLRIH